MQFFFLLPLHTVCNGFFASGLISFVLTIFLMVHSGHLLFKPLLTLFKRMNRVLYSRFCAIWRSSQKTEWHCL